MNFTLSCLFFFLNFQCGMIKVLYETHYYMLRGALVRRRVQFLLQQSCKAKA